MSCISHNSCILLTSENINRLNAKCHPSWPTDKCYIYNYGVNISQLNEIFDYFFTVLDIPPICEDTVEAYLCHYMYPGCNPITGQPEGVCEVDCVSYTEEGRCSMDFDGIATIAEITGKFPFEKQCNYTLSFLERFQKEFTYNPNACWNASGTLYLYYYMYAY